MNKMAAFNRATTNVFNISLHNSRLVLNNTERLSDNNVDSIDDIVNDSSGQDSSPAEGAGHLSSHQSSQLLKEYPAADYSTDVSKGGAADVSKGGAADVSKGRAADVVSKQGTLTRAASIAQKRLIELSTVEEYPAHPPPTLNNNVALTTKKKKIGRPRKADSSNECSQESDYLKDNISFFGTPFSTNSLDE